MLERAAAGEEIPLFTDEWRSPVAISDVVSAVGEIAAGDFEGLLHLGGPRLTRYELGLAVLTKHGLEGRARPASLREFAGPPRARDTSFDCALAKSSLRAPPRGLDAILDDC